MPGTSNVYVSVTRAVIVDSGHGYRKPPHTWIMSIEPHDAHHFHVPGTSRKDPEPVHYAASWNDEHGLYTVKTHSVESEPGIIGNILIAESAQVSPEQLHELLEKELGPNSSTESSKEKSGGDEPEHWIRTAIRAMQERKMAEMFDLEEFMTFARGYEANRAENEAPALIAYPKIHKDHEKKSSKHKFWVSHPQAGHRTKLNDRGEASVYGGLM